MTTATELQLNWS